MRKIISSIAVCAMVFSVSAKDVDAEQVVQDSLFDGIYAGLGIGGSFLKTTGGIPTQGFDLDSDMEADRFSGSVVIGTSKVINRIYGGFEVLLDVMKNKKHEWTDADRNMEMKGVIPQLNLRAGYSFTHDTVVFGKVGCAWSRVSARQPDGSTTHVTADRSKTKASIVLGIGAEKAFNNRFSTSLEVDYNFGASASPTTNDKLRWTKGWNIRALAKYNVKI